MRDDAFTRTERDAGLYERRRADMPPQRPDPSEYEERDGWDAWEGFDEEEGAPDG